MQPPLDAKQVKHRQILPGGWLHGQYGMDRQTKKAHPLLRTGVPTWQRVMEEMGGRLPLRRCGSLTTTNGRSSIWLMVLKICTGEHLVSLLLSSNDMTPAAGSLWRAFTLHSLSLLR